MDLEAQTELLARLLEERMDVRGADFAVKLRRAGRRLPRHLRQKGQMLVAAQARAGHPRLLAQLDEAALALAAADLERYLRGIDPWVRRRSLVLNWAADLAFKLLLLALCLGVGAYALGGL